MAQEQEKICVYYDGVCPQCIKDRHTYEKLAGNKGENVSWIDITGREKQLTAMGIDPAKALTELHIKTKDGVILSELDAYIVLMKNVPVLRPLAWFIGLPLIRPLLANIYHRQVNQRLTKSGRI